LVVKHFGGAISEEVPYVPAKTISPALKGDHYTAFSMMLEDKAVKAEIEVENINGSILLISGIKTINGQPPKCLTKLLSDYNKIILNITIPH
jgi:hypothetical protein